MQLSPVPSKSHAVVLYERFAAAWRALGELDPEDDPRPFHAVIRARDALLAAVGLPGTGHNTGRLYDAAETGRDLAWWLDDVDLAPPPVVRRDEALLLVWLAEAFGHRAVAGREERLADIAAALGVPPHAHNTGALCAWLEGDLAFASLVHHLTADVETLATAVA